MRSLECTEVMENFGIITRLRKERAKGEISILQFFGLRAGPLSGNRMGKSPIGNLPSSWLLQI